MMAPLTKDSEFELRFENQTAVVSPFGASLRSYVLNTPDGVWNVIWGYRGGENKKGGQGDVLIPFPGRIRDGAYTVDGKALQLLKNDKDGPNAIHGFVRSEMFGVASVSEREIRFSLELSAVQFAERGYPFSIRVEVIYDLGPAGLTTRFKIKNIGDRPAPVGAGFHPYFCADVGTMSDWAVQIPAKNYVELEKHLPTGKILPADGTRFDFREERRIAHESYNACLAHLDRSTDGLAHATLRAKDSQNRIVITMDSSFDYVVIYTGDQIPAPYARRGFAIEPMTCAPDAFNREGWGARMLAVGDELGGSYVILPVHSTRNERAK